MRETSPGHVYWLRKLDYCDGCPEETVLTFVKRCGPGYPGNSGQHTGTTTQEVLRACIARLRYVDGQEHDPRNTACISKLEDCVWMLEYRAAQRHGRPYPPGDADGIAFAVYGELCVKCGHTGCEGGCRVL